MKNNNLDQLRHSMAHLLVAAVRDIWPDAQNAIGPAIENGFYQDFDMGEVKVSNDDFPKIEARMRKLLKKWGPFKEQVVTPAEAKKEFAWNKYKTELIDDFAKGDKTITLNNPGNFIDLCRGGHVDNPKVEMKHFKLLSIAGAYWKGDEKNKMLTRIYGTAFPSQEELDKHLWMLEEAKKRDHRKIGAEQELFIISEEVGPGLPIWLPKGAIIREELEQWAKQTEKEWGYQAVATPHITKEGLYHTSGHLPYYEDDMFPAMELDGGEKYYLKPMNCPHHHMVFKARSRSYRELPLRIAENGMCYRYEGSGELFGLMRVRALDINDAHIYCTIEQAAEEFAQVMRLHEYYYKSLGINDYYLEMALRDPKDKDKYHGDEKMWKLAEKLMREAVSKVDIEMIEEEGSAAFYGPKIDFVIRSSIGREFAVSTNQIDLYMGDRFKLKYTDSDGSEQTPAIIHRAPLGSQERFIGFLIEHFAGAFPLWLSPVQILLTTISKDQVPYAKEVEKELKAAGIRVELDDSDRSLGKKLAVASSQKHPYIGIIGTKEAGSGEITVKARDGKQDNYSLDPLIEKLTQEIKEKSL